MSLKLLLGPTMYSRLDRPPRMARGGPSDLKPPAPFPGACLEKPGSTEPSPVLLTSQSLLSSPAVSGGPISPPCRCSDLVPRIQTPQCVMLVSSNPTHLHFIGPHKFVYQVCTLPSSLPTQSSTLALLHGMCPPSASLSQYCDQLYSVSFLCATSPLLPCPACLCTRLMLSRCQVKIGQ